jgi:hypothetical protein
MKYSKYPPPADDPSLRIFHEKTRLEACYRPLWWQINGLSFTQSGYGRRIPTALMVRFPGECRWRRVYCCVYGNGGFCFVGKDLSTGRKIE